MAVAQTKDDTFRVSKQQSTANLFSDRGSPYTQILMKVIGERGRLSTHRILVRNISKVQIVFCFSFPDQRVSLHTQTWNSGGRGAGLASDKFCHSVGSSALWPGTPEKGSCGKGLCIPPG